MQGTQGTQGDWRRERETNVRLAYASALGGTLTTALMVVLGLLCAGMIVGGFLEYLWSDYTRGNAYWSQQVDVINLMIDALIPAVIALAVCGIGGAITFAVLRGRLAKGKGGGMPEGSASSFDDVEAMAQDPQLHMARIASTLNDDLDAADATVIAAGFGIISAQVDASNGYLRSQGRREVSRTIWWAVVGVAAAFVAFAVVATVYEGVTAKREVLAVEHAAADRVSEALGMEESQFFETAIGGADGAADVSFSDYPDDGAGRFVSVTINPDGSFAEVYVSVSRDDDDDPTAEELAAELERTLEDLGEGIDLPDGVAASVPDELRAASPAVGDELTVDDDAADVERSWTLELDEYELSLTYRAAA